jgi:uncharacterized protein (TIGR02679 family)
MNRPADPRLERLLGGPELGSIRQRLRRRFEQAEPDAPPARLRLDKLTPTECAALCQLTGRAAHTARSMTLDVADLNEQLCRANLADSLRDALERLDGPIVSPAQLRQARQAQWTNLVAAASVGWRLRAWLDEAPDALARLKRLGRDPEGAKKLLFAANAVLLRLPAQGQARSQLAAETLGDAHALDADRPVAKLALAVWRHGERRLPVDSASDEEAETGPSHSEAAEERQRDIWARAGVLVNELARPALLLNLPVIDPAQARWKPGEPAYLSLRHLLRAPPTWAVAGQTVFICENPNLLAIAADRLGVHCAPFVCTDGMPAAAQRALLDQLQNAGARLRYHGDFDWPGIYIANFVMRTWQATPWRLAADDYEAAARRAARTPSVLGQPNLGETDVTAIWDAQLVPVMQSHKIPIAEEAVAASLLDDLRVNNGSWGGA